MPAATSVGCIKQQVKGGVDHSMENRLGVMAPFSVAFKGVNKFNDWKLTFNKSDQK